MRMKMLPTPIVPARPTPTKPFAGYAKRRTQDIISAGPFALEQTDLLLQGPSIPSPATPIVSAAGGFVNKLRNGSFDIWQRGAQVNSIASGIPGYCADGWVHVWLGTVGTVMRSPGRGPTAYSLGFSNPTGVYTDMQLAQRIESQIACALGGENCIFQTQLFNGTSGGEDIGNGVTLSIGHPTQTNNFNSTIVWDIQNAQLQPCPQGAWTQVAYTFNLPAASAQAGILVQLDFGQAINSSSDVVNITECDLRTTASSALGLTSNPPTPEIRPYTLELLLCSAYYQNVETLPMFFGNVSISQTYYCAAEFVTPMRASPTITTIDVQNSGFPMGAPVVNYQSSNGFRVSKSTTNVATSPAFYIFGYTASAEL